jgi:RHS repeat-associated protein
MAGDNLSATVQYYYQGTTTNTSSNSLANDIANNLVSVISNSAVTSIATKGGAVAIGANLSGTPPFASITDPNQNSTDNLPRAYLSIVFFDERFNFVSENSTVIRVNGNTNSSLTIPNVAAPKNGYAYIYLSNESDIPVYFDNFNVANTRGRIIEENHYYAYGLKIAGISSKKLGDPNEGSLKNNYLYNDKEIDDEGDLNWEDYGFRNYDPQIGRFVQVDPLTDDYPALSGYHYALNDPITNIDEDGLSALSPVQQVACWAGQSAALVGLMNTLRTVEQIASISVNVAKIAGDIASYEYSKSDNVYLGLLNGREGKQIGSSDYGDNSIYKKEVVKIKELKYGNDITMEGVISKLMEMKKGEFKTGKEINELSPKFKKMPVSLHKILETVERTGDGIKIKLTWIARAILATVPGVPDIKDGATIKITRVIWPKDKYSVWHIYSEGVTNVKYNHGNGNIQKGKLDIYLHNNAYTDKIEQGHPSVWQIFKGNWYTP